MSGAVLALENVRCRFGGLQVLAGIDLSVLEGSIIGLIGSNGSGKTTLLNVINGFTPPGSGSIQLGGREISRSPVHARSAQGMGRVFQESRVWPEWTVSEHISIATARIRRSNDEILRIAPEGEEVAGKAAGALPLFERRKLELVMAALAGSSILLVDEIGAGLNLAESRAIYERVTTLVRQGHCRAAIMVEHKINLLVSYATELCFLHEGRVSDRVQCSEQEKVAALVGQMLAPAARGDR